MAESWWVKLHADVEDVLRAVTMDHGIAALGTWTRLLLEAKRGPVDDFGIVTTSVREWAHACWDEPREDLWRALLDAGLLELVDGTLASRFTVRVLGGFAENQRRRGRSNTERSQRARARAKALQTGDGVSIATNPALPRTPCNGTRADATPEPLQVVSRDTDCNDRQDETREIEPPNGVSSSGKHRTVSTKGPDAIAEDYTRRRAQLNGLGDLFDQLADVMAAERKRGAVRQSVVLRQLLTPLHESLSGGDLTEAQLRHGMQQALAANDGDGVANWNWIRKAATNYRPATTTPPNHEPKATNGYIRNVLNF